MKLAISGTYSSGKTLTSYALSHLVDMPRTRARTMRELLPFAVPGKTLEQCDGAELIQLIVRRHVERVVHESHLSTGFVSDGSSLQEWLYGSVRVIVGINPNDSVHLSDVQTVERTPEMLFFEHVMDQLGVAIKEHVKNTYDVFVHLPNELELAKDGHRPVNERFRRLADEGIAAAIDELGIPRHVIGGTLVQRLEGIVEVLGLTPVTDVHTAIARAQDEYRKVDMTIESDRAWAVASA
ncbi:AAA family ATPase [Actinokineospora globicatena]|uniref:ATP-binding protein n=1 Tax=Actinokineospora globicatena TaxID=103729 RepID=A0A9W6QPF9_9PSEU|nr:AAA family ATPase [Actinokineospora globicatena]MCP2306034.1 AAA domain-containing protein [Actinokineospora globicatena]GLW80093.1 ATP-binding protein [Actinokineospora globicatena]GLW86922.1 ATP-binding protein [Actinokineospora globicatena]GLW93282.1 ATP-binding protein [Actinokineospora globicatena]